MGEEMEEESISTDSYKSSIVIGANTQINRLLLVIWTKINANTIEV